MLIWGKMELLSILCHRRVPFCTLKIDFFSRDFRKSLKRNVARDVQLSCKRMQYSADEVSGHVRNISSNLMRWWHVSGHVRGPLFQWDDDIINMGNFIVCGCQGLALSIIGVTIINEIIISTTCYVHIMNVTRTAYSPYKDYIICFSAVWRHVICACQGYLPGL